MTNTVNATQDIRNCFMYGYGRCSAQGAHFSVQSMRVDLARSAGEGRIALKGHVGKTFERAGALAGSLYDAGGYNIGWAVAQDMAVVKIRGESTQSGYSSHVGECYILLSKTGPVFSLDMTVPQHADFPSNELRVFHGAGYVLSADELHEMKLMRRITDQILDTIYWPTKFSDDDEYFSPISDAGVFNYTEEQPARAAKPKLIFSKQKGDAKKVVEVPMFVPDTRLRRRIKLGK